MLKQFYFKQFSLAWVGSLVLFNVKIGPYQVLPLLARVDLGAKGMNGFSAFPKTTASNCIVSYQDTRWEALPLRRDTVGVFYKPGRLGQDR